MMYVCVVSQISLCVSQSLFEFLMEDSECSACGFWQAHHIKKHATRLLELFKEEGVSQLCSKYVYPYGSDIVESTYLNGLENILIICVAVCLVPLTLLHTPSCLQRYWQCDITLDRIGTSTGTSTQAPVLVATTRLIIQYNLEKLSLTSFKYN